jgi:hypothetical protein
MGYYECLVSSDSLGAGRPGGRWGVEPGAPQGQIGKGTTSPMPRVSEKEESKVLRRRPARGNGTAGEPARKIGDPSGLRRPNAWWTERLEPWQGVAGHAPNLRLQRTALRATAEPLSR